MSDSLILAAFKQAMTIVNPVARLDPMHEQYFEQNVRRSIGHVDEEFVVNIIRWSALQDRFRGLFLEKQPVFAFLNDWNKVSGEYVHQMNRPKTVHANDPEPEMDAAHQRSLREWYAMQGNPSFHYAAFAPMEPGKQLAEKIGWYGSKEEAVYLDLQRKLAAAAAGVVQGPDGDG